MLLRKSLHDHEACGCLYESLRGSIHLPLLIPPPSCPSSIVIMASKTGSSSLNGSALVAAITSVCSSGFLLFGYGMYHPHATGGETDARKTRASCPASSSRNTGSL